VSGSKASTRFNHAGLIVYALVEKMRRPVLIAPA
jgi:hypothetical protein